MTTVTLPGFGGSSRILFISMLLVCSATLSAENVDVWLRSFPIDADVYFLSPGAEEEGQLLVADGRDGTWRIFRNLTLPLVLELRSDAYRSRRLHITETAGESFTGGPLQLEERLLPRSGVLELLAEAPTGRSPKSATFLSNDVIAVPLLRDDGIDLYRIVRDRWGSVEIRYDRRISPPSPWDDAEGFVEPLVLPQSRELWVSQMTTEKVHRFDLDTGRWIGVLSSGGGWPKVLAAENGEETVWVSNWQGQSVAALDRRNGGIAATVAVGGEPRGILLTDNDRYLWTCLFSSGEIVKVDTMISTVVDRFGPSVGAARHIVEHPGNGRIYYSDMYHGTVTVIDPVEGDQVLSRRVGININTIVFDGSGRYLFVSERGRNNPESYLIPGPEFGRVIVLDPNTLETIQEVYGRHQPTGLAVSPDGNYLVGTDFLDDNLSLYRIHR